MKGKIIFLSGLLVFLLLTFLTLPSFAQVATRGISEHTISESITCGNGICEFIDFGVKKGEEKTIEIAGETYIFKILTHATTKEELLDDEGNAYGYTYKYTAAVNGEEITSEEILEKYGFLPDLVTIHEEGELQIQIYEVEVDGCKKPDCLFDVELNIYKKWNLAPISLLEEKFLKSGTCKPRDFLVVYGYDSINKKYITLFTYGKSFYDLESKLREFGKTGQSEDRVVMVGTPYNSVWIYSLNECKLAAEVPSQGKNMLLSLDAAKAQGMKFYFALGWNFWTGSPDMEGKSFDEIKGDCEIEKPHTFEAQSQSWKALETPPGLATNFIFKVKDACMFGTVIPEAPALPE